MHPHEQACLSIEDSTEENRPEYDVRGLAAELQGLRELHSLSSWLLSAHDVETAAKYTLDVIIELLDADRGTMQFYDPAVGGLRILAYRGFEAEQIESFPIICEDFHSTCARALKSGRRIIVEDFETDPKAEAHRETAAILGYRAAQSTPLAASGEIIGMVTTHFRRPRTLKERELRLIDLCAAQAVLLMQRARAVEWQRESEQRFRDMADAAPAILWMTRPDSACTYLSHGWLEYTGQAIEDLLGFEWLDSVHPDDLEQAKSIVVEAHKRRESFSMDYRIQTAEGEYRWAVDTGRPRFDAEGRFLGFVGSVIDVHDRKKLELAVMETDRRKNEFLDTLAHELRNPLAPIRSGLSLLKKKQNRAEEFAKVHRTIDRQTQQLARLVDDLLDASRITRGKLGLQTRRTTVKQIIDNAVEALQRQIENAGHELLTAVPDEALLIEVDPQRLSQVLTNILSNAVKYTPDGGRIHVSGEKIGSEAVITVRDNGIGIDADKLEEIFVLFAQADRPQERGYSGLGIGLTLAKSLAALHGGSIEAESAGPGRGSTFRIRLPLAAASEDTERPALVELEKEDITEGGLEDEEPQERCCRVLVVDDNDAAALMLGMVVERLGNQVRTACDGERAVEAAAEFLPDVILMDLGMPNMDGYEAARRIRRQPWGDHITLVALTGWGQDEDRRRTTEAGFDHHIVKPAELATLKALINRR